jgi:hypothetical protein
MFTGYLAEPSALLFADFQVKNSHCEAFIQNQAAVCGGEVIGSTESGK